MSASLLKRSLQLFEEDRPSHSTELVGSKKKRNIKKARNEDESTKQQHEWKEMPGRAMKRPGLQTRNKKNAHAESHKYKKSDNTEESLSFLERLSHLDASSSSSVQKVMLHHKDQKSRKTVEEETHKNKLTESLFSESDFDTFEKEHDWWTS